MPEELKKEKFFEYSRLDKLDMLNYPNLKRKSFEEAAKNEAVLPGRCMVWYGFVFAPTNGGAYGSLKLVIVQP